MIVKVTLSIEVNEKDYPKLKQSEIRKIVKENAEASHSIDYILDTAKPTLEEEDFFK
jgi:hypothetical protein